MATYSTFTINANKMNGYPSFPELPDNFTDNQADLINYNFTTKVKDLGGELNDYPSLRLGPFLENKFSSEYVFKVDEGEDYLRGYPFLKNVPVNIVDDFTVFSKYVFCHQNDEKYVDGYPTLGEQILEQFGAGKDSGIYEITIPKTVLFIADYAFYNSDIQRVRLNRHCIYYEHSFPPGCVLIPYKEDE